MAEPQTLEQFHRDPLRFLDRAFPAAGDAFWLPGRELCVAAPEPARAVLANDAGLYEEHSDFFCTKRGTFGPRAVQVEIGRGARTLLRAHVVAGAGELAAAVDGLAPESEWPDAGNRLVFRHLAAALIEPASPPSLRRTVEQIVERAVLAGALDRHSRLGRAVFRVRAMRELARAVEERRRRAAGPPADLLDVVVGAAGDEVPAAELGEVFLSSLFAIAGSVGFTLGWSVYLVGTHPDADARPAWVVREALRLWPIAWMLGRRPTRRHEVAGVEVTPRDRVVVCPYLVHRHPRYWPEPNRFLPQRWGQSPDPQAFIPFGWGPHTCAAASLSLQLVESILATLFEGYDLSIRTDDPRPCVGPALAPPRFGLRLTPRRPSSQAKGGE